MSFQREFEEAHLTSIVNDKIGKFAFFSGVATFEWDAHHQEFFLAHVRLKPWSSKQPDWVLDGKGTALEQGLFDGLKTSLWDMFCEDMDREARLMLLDRRPPEVEYGCPARL